MKQRYGRTKRYIEIFKIFKKAYPEEILYNAPVTERDLASNEKMREGFSEVSNTSYDTVSAANNFVSETIGLSLIDMASFFDPSGITSIPGAEAAIDDYEKSPTITNGFIMVASILAALPLITYIGKLAKAPALLARFSNALNASNKISQSSKAITQNKIRKAQVTLKTLIESEKAIERLANFLRPIIREGYSYGTHTIGSLGKKGRNADTGAVLEKMRESGGLAISTLDLNKKFEATIIPWGSGTAEDIARRMIKSVNEAYDFYDNSTDAVRNFADYIIGSEPTLIIEFPGEIMSKTSLSDEFQRALGAVVEEIDLSKIDLSSIQKKHKRGSTITHILPSEYIVGVIRNGKIEKF